MSEPSVDYKNALKEISETDKSIILYAIPCDADTHPVIAKCSAVFVRNVSSKITYCFSFFHMDNTPVVDRETFMKDFSELPNRKWVFDKKSFNQMNPISNLLDIDLFRHTNYGKTFDRKTFETNAHKFVYRTNRNFKDLNNSIPILKHKEMFDTMCDAFTHESKLDEYLSVGYLKVNSTIIDALGEIETNGVYVNSDCFKNHFDVKPYQDEYVFTQYNIYTPTGRPSNHFQNINYAALNKSNGVRQCFTSRFGSDGKLILIDYSAFHPRIICHLIKFPLAIDIDIYKYLGEMYFKRELINDSDIDESKTLTFRQLYGGVEPQFEHIKYFARLKSFIESNWTQFQKDGVVLTPLFKRPLTDKHIIEPNPNKLFNYILQATETEIAATALLHVNTYLRKKKTKAVLYTYDSILFDFHLEDGESTLQDIKKIMKMNDSFPIKVYSGESYNSLIQINH